MKFKNLHYGWFMVAIAALVLATHTLIIYTFGTFIIPLTAEFNWDRGALSGALSIQSLLFALCGILSGKLSDKYGPRILATTGGLLTGAGLLLMSQVSSLWQVYLIWGLLMGIGGSCCYVPIISTIPRWFEKKRGIALGISATGIGVGAILWPPLTQWLISSYSWQQAFMILGLINLIIIIPLAQFTKHSPQQVGLRPYGEDSTIEDKELSTSATEGLSLNQAIKTRPFWIFGLILFCCLFSVMTIIVHIIPHAVNIGISAMVAASILSTIAGSSAIGRLSTGFISDKIGGRLALSISLILVTLSLIWLLFAQETWMFYLFAVVFGFAYGGISPLLTIIAAELFGLTSLGILVGSFSLCAAVGGALGPPSAGSIFDITGNYSLAFLICVIIGALAIILSLILLKAKTWHGNH